MVDEEEITEETVAYYLGENERVGGADGWLDDFQDMKLNEAKDKFEKDFIERVLRQNGSNISKTAEVLGIYPSNLHGKIKKLGIHINK
jgi:two-component system nitrogen regulation response regulator NtrX